ncbi:MAG: MT-A70 family methyltransferase [Lachnospiraceae bacterium]
MNKFVQEKFGTMIMDPPWSHQQLGAGRGACRHYDLMPLDRIKGMPIADLMKPDSVLWIWTTNAALRDTYDVMEGYGYTPRSLMTWCKPRLGLGNYLRNTTEHVLMGTRGKPEILFRSQPTWMFAPVQDHSHKPEEFHEIVKRFSPGAYIELFARRRYPGFLVWGNEIDSDIVIQGYPVPSDKNHREEA